MASFDVSLQDAIQQGLCNTLAVAEGTASLGSQFYGAVGLRGASQTSEQAAQMWSNAAGVFCNREPQNMSNEIGPGIIGGQCSGTRYTFNLSYDVEGQPSQFFPNVVGIGPINVSVVGLDYVLTATQGVSGLPGNWRDFGRFNIGFAEITSNVNVEILSGDPDDCGNQEPSVPPYDPADFTVPTTVSFDDENGDPKTEEVTNIFGPVRIGPGGDFIVPVEVDFNEGGKLFGDINLTTGDINIGGGNSGGGGTSGPEREKDPDDGLSPGEIIVGVRVVVNSFDPNDARITEIFTPGDAPNLLVPRVANVLFRYNTSVGNGWGSPVDAKSQEAIIYSDEPAVDAVVVFRQGVTGTFTWIVKTDVECCQG